MGTNRSLWIGLALLLGLLTACQSQETTSNQQPGEGVGLQLKSTAFGHSEEIPVRFTCDGEDVSPPLSWSEPPPGTQSLVLIVDDPEAPGGTWDHWLLFNIPATTRDLPEAVSAEPQPHGVGAQGANSWQSLGYGGPCPPPGSTHLYAFRLYALDSDLIIEPGSAKKEVEQAMQGHILAEGILTGRYGR